LAETIVAEHHYSLIEALTMPLNEAFLLFTACAIRNGAVPVCGYEMQEEVKALRSSGKSWRML
jgi:hypothetical protein